MVLSHFSLVFYNIILFQKDLVLFELKIDLIFLVLAFLIHFILVNIALKFYPDLMIVFLMQAFKLLKQIDFLVNPKIKNILT